MIALLIDDRNGRCHPPRLNYGHPCHDGAQSRVEIVARYPAVEQEQSVLHVRRQLLVLVEISGKCLRRPSVYALPGLAEEDPSRVLQLSLNFDLADRPEIFDRKLANDPYKTLDRSAGATGSIEGWVGWHRRLPLSRYLTSLRPPKTRFQSLERRNQRLLR